MRSIFNSCFIGILLFSISARAQENIQRLENPFSTQFLKSNLKKTTPRLVLTPSIEKSLKSKIKSDPVVKNYYGAIVLNAKKILTQPLLKRELEGRRLLGVSREMLYRMNMLCMVYRMYNDT
jgi:hypothetical protein